MKARREPNVSLLTLLQSSIWRMSGYDDWNIADNPEKWRIAGLKIRERERYFASHDK